MEEIVSADLVPTRRGRHHLLIWVTICSFTIVFISTVWIATYIINNNEQMIEVSVPVLVLCGIANMLILLGALAHEIFYWRVGRKDFLHLLNDTAKSIVPIEEMAAVRGAYSEFAKPITKMLQDRRAMLARIDQLNEDLRQRVANRTEALERQLGILKAKASRDALTGLFNRRSLEEELQQIVDACRKSRRDLVLMMIDVDYFKMLNDTLGHQMGDEFLKNLGALIRSSIRQLDSAYRYGGDEVVILMPDSDRPSANVLANRLKVLTDGLTKHHRNLSPRPQLSIGICVLSDLPADTDTAGFLRMADEQLYKIKHARKIKSRSVA